MVHHTHRSNARLSSGDVADEAAFMREIQQSHFDRGFMDIGYHFMVMPSGRVFLGRPLSAFGAHVQRHNAGAVGVAVAGNFDDAPPTDEALASLERVIGRVLRRRRVPVVGHGDLADEPTTCPGQFLRLHLRSRPAP